MKNYRETEDLYEIINRILAALNTMNTVIESLERQIRAFNPQKFRKGS